jgi:predicted RNA-binding protein with RPS1 domain
VSSVANYGVFIDTEKGSGLVPTRELLLAHGSDHRRVFPVGSQLTVALLSRDAQSGKLTFSMKAVADVEERRNFAQFAAEQRQQPGEAVGSFGEMLRQKLNLPSEPTPKAMPPKPLVQASPTLAPRPGASESSPPSARVGVGAVTRRVRPR